MIFLMALLLVSVFSLNAMDNAAPSVPSSLPYYSGKARAVQDGIGIGDLYDQIEWIGPGTYNVFDLKQQKIKLVMKRPRAALVGPLGVWHYPPEGRFEVSENLKVTLAVAACDGTTLMVHNMSASTPISAIVEMMRRQMAIDKKENIAVRLFVVEDVTQCDKDLFQKVAKNPVREALVLLKTALCQLLSIERSQVLAQLVSNPSASDKFVAIPLFNVHENISKHIRFCVTNPFKEHMFYGKDEEINMMILNYLWIPIMDEHNKHRETVVVPILMKKIQLDILENCASPFRRFISDC